MCHVESVYRATVALLLFRVSKASPPSTPVSLAKRATCTPASAGSSSTDDVPAIRSAITSCGNGGIIVIPAGKTYAIRSTLDFDGCVGCDFQIEGTLKVSNDVDGWEGVRAIFHLEGISGASIYSATGTGLVDGNGQPYWDAFAADSSYKRPTLMYIEDGSSDITVRDLRFKNPPNVFHSVSGSSKNVLYTRLVLTAAQASDEPDGAVPKNTDGFDVGQSTYVTISDTKVSNQDDCVAFKPGSNFVTVTNITCTGSHGLSVGSLGKSAGSTDTVQNIIVDGATMIGSTKAVGIKLYQGGSDHGVATVKNVTYNNVNVQGCDYAAQIQSCYGSDSAAHVPPLHRLRLSPTCTSMDSRTIVNLNCPSAGTCDIYFDDFNVKPASGTAAYLCSNIDNSNYGLSCTGSASG
ncbi:putative endo-xylogalacturonan hydrolase A [Hymenopellis radicata]|nr:putative endo-xylogalacturonan hydrolase A [Hymenopellis radicata]